MKDSKVNKNVRYETGVTGTQTDSQYDASVRMVEKYSVSVRKYGQLMFVLGRVL